MDIDMLIGGLEDSCGLLLDSGFNKHIGILTAGGDSPGLNAAIRGIGKSAIRSNRMDII